MPTSQNAYPVFTAARYDGPLPRLRAWKVPGTDVVLPLRDGSTGFLLVFHALWHHEHIDRIDQPHPKDDWGYAFRSIRGQSSGYSNHASGTAMDLDATEHPLGVEGTFGFVQRGVRIARRNVRRINAATRTRARLRFKMRGTIRWGGDYSSRKDEMHFEIVKDLATCERRAQELMKTKAGRRILRENPGAREAILA